MAGFFSELLGSAGAKRAEALGARNASTINSGYDSADAYSRTGYDTSQGFLQPYADTARRGYDLYADSYGVNGADAQGRAFSQYQGDPFYAHANDQTGNALSNLFKRYHAQGMGNSGNSMLALSRAGLEAQDRRIGEWRGGLGQFANQGVQLAGQQSGLANNFYTGMADRALGRAGALTQNDTAATIAGNNSRAAGMNNLMSVFGTVAGAGTRMATGGFR